MSNRPKEFVDLGANGRDRHCLALDQFPEDRLPIVAMLIIGGRGERHAASVVGQEDLFGRQLDVIWGHAKTFSDMSSNLSKRGVVLVKHGIEANASPRAQSIVKTADRGALGGVIQGVGAPIPHGGAIVADADAKAQCVEKFYLVVVYQGAVGDDVEARFWIGRAQCSCQDPKNLPVDQGFAAPKFDTNAASFPICSAIEPGREVSQEGLDIANVPLDFMGLGRLIAVGTGVIALEPHLDLQCADIPAFGGGIVGGDWIDWRPIWY